MTLSSRSLSAMLLLALILTVTTVCNAAAGDGSHGTSIYKARMLLQAKAPVRPVEPRTYRTVIEFLKSQPSLSTIYGAAMLADDDSRLAGLNDPGFIGTVFLPTNAGLINNAPQIRDELDVKSEAQVWTDPQLAARFVANHIVADRALKAAALDRGTTLKSVLGQEVKVGDTSWWRTITTVGGLFASGDIVVQGEGGNFVKVVRPDVEAGRAIVHVIDGPIIPEKDKWLSWVPIIGR